MHFVNDAHRFRKIDKMIEKVGVANLFVSSITVYEIQTKLVKAKVGKAKLNALAETLAIFKVVNLSTGAAVAAAKVRAELENAGDWIGHLDQMLAGHAKHEKAILVTNNTKHFKLVYGLKIEDWAA
jgi:tRNA(fMet)-specific endonuclease VapC